MATTTNYGWTTPDDTALVKDGASAIRTLGSSVDTTTKALNPSTTLGDIEYRSSTANTNTRLPIGTSGQVLAVSGGVPAWTTSSSGGITLISETVASGLSSLSLSSIPSTYKDLLLVWHGIYPSDITTSFGIRFNNDSTASRYQGKLGAWGSTPTGIDSDNTTNASGSNAYPFGPTGGSSGDALRNNAQGTLMIYNYASTSKFKVYEMMFTHNNSSGDQKGYLTLSNYASTSAITSIDVYRGAGSGTFSNVSNTSIRLYGVA